ncbi:hypothetical protein Tco_0211379 [Tanacetum coccineum]
MEKKAKYQSGQNRQLIQKPQLGVGSSNEVRESWVRTVNGENVESHPHNKGLWSKVTPPNRGNLFGAYNASDHIFLLMGTPSTSNAGTSQPPMRFEKVEVLEKSMKDLTQARKKDKEIFEKAIGKERRLGEEKYETFMEARRGVYTIEGSTSHSPLCINNRCLIRELRNDNFMVQNGVDVNEISRL